MSERFYALLLRLYPSSFRQAYGEEALQLFRDRLRDERRLVSRLRLWIDLMIDLAVSVPRSYRAFPAVIASPALIATQPSRGAPIFLVLEDEPLSIGSVLCGMSAALVLYGVLLFLLAHGGRSLPIQFSDTQRSSVGFSADAQPQSGAADGSSAALAARASGIDGHPSPVAGEQTGASDIDRRALAFDVVSIREDKSGAGLQSMENGPTPYGYRMSGGPLLTLIQTAYRPSEGTLSFRPNRISGLPPWAYSTLYDVNAKISEADYVAWRDPSLQPGMLRTMLQTMMADRFKLVVHREDRVVPIYELTVGKKGPKLKAYNGATLAEIRQRHPDAHELAGGPIVATGPNPGQQWFFGVTMSQLGTLLSNLAGRPVLDKTGLTGRYDVTYQMELRPPAREDGTSAPVPPDFFSSQISTIVQDQLGLKLKAGNGPVEVLVIDHVEQPSEN
jgi:uncharacterized protein (TIGR03435 family)